MPCSSSSTIAGGGVGGSEDENGSLCSFKLNDSTFLAELMPKKDIGADRFIELTPSTMAAASLSLYLVLKLSFYFLRED
ncbi:hypothetical protein MANES_06G148952v8 [Manihot esculenta]|uniref:Uncharacterized protein n=1 Tax=Manihot esculenta TaxID=3983 RepID=A0ACB7HPY8_MANES|nr:hypothetical protein MANES_06G148952v8 [Manihot esculenta]